jgi:hypothetical protein
MPLKQVGYSCQIGEITMKQLQVIILAAGLLGAGGSAAYAKVNPDDFTINVHVKSSSAGQDCKDNPGGRQVCKTTQDVKATIDGKTYELLAEAYFSKGVLPPGDYKARVLGKETDSKQMLKRKYEFLLEDGSTRKFKVVGMEE